MARHKVSANNGEMSVNEAGRRGGERTNQTHGREFYENIGHKGGEASGRKVGQRSRRSKDDKNVQ